MPPKLEGDGSIYTNASEESTLQRSGSLSHSDNAPFPNPVPPSPALSTESSVHFCLPPTVALRETSMKQKHITKLVPVERSLSDETIHSLFTAASGSQRRSFYSGRGSSYTTLPSAVSEPSPTPPESHPDRLKPPHPRSHSLSVSFKNTRWSLSLTSIPRDTSEGTRILQGESSWKKLRQRFGRIEAPKRKIIIKPRPFTLSSHSALSPRTGRDFLPPTPEEFEDTFRKVLHQLSPKGSRGFLRLFSSYHMLGHSEDMIWVLNKTFPHEYFKQKIVCLPARDLQIFVDATQQIVSKNPKGILDKQHEKFGLRVLQLQVRIAQERNIFPSSLYIKSIKLSSRDPVSGGGFADVFCATHEGQLVALKRIRVFKTDAGFKAISTQIYRECLIWQRLKHEHVLPFMGVDRDSFPAMICLVSPWMKNGTIIMYLSTHDIQDPVHLKRMIYGISCGLAYLHSEDIVHADLRGANILVSDNGEPRLTDFGLTIIADSSMNRSGTTTSITGAVKWMSPEVLCPANFGLDSSQKTFASDVYAFACVIIEVYTRKPPFCDLCDGAALFPILDGKRPIRPQGMEDEVWEVTERCWNHDFIERPSMSEVIRWIEPWK